jgi:hypothetical protein
LFVCCCFLLFDCLFVCLSCAFLTSRTSRKSWPM